MYARLIRNRWGEIVLVRLAPACIFSYFLANAAWAVARNMGWYLNGGQASRLFVIGILEQCLALIFLGSMVVLFLVRRSVVGPHSSALGGLVALAGTYLLSLPVPATASVEVAPELNRALVGLSLTCVTGGMALSVVSVLALGRCFGIMPEARGLVTRGPYRWIRHPLYVGESIFCLGGVLANRSPSTAALFVAYIAVQYWRARMEENALRHAFPAAYAEYRGRTPGFMPDLKRASALSSRHRASAVDAIA